MSSGFTVVWASASGTSRDCAEATGRRLARRFRGTDVRVQPLDRRLIDKIIASTEVDARVYVYLVSTTGDGDMPEHAKEGWMMLLRRDLPPTLLARHRFALFGFGDSSYIKFNAAARKLHVRLRQLGASEVCERGLGDDLSPLGSIGDFDTWTKNALLPALHDLTGVPVPDGEDAPQLMACRFLVRRDDAPGHASSPADRALALARVHGSAAVSVSRVCVHTRMTAPTWTQDVRHLEIDTAESGIRYEAGDVAVLYPDNTHAGQYSITALCQRVGWDERDVLAIEVIPNGAAVVCTDARYDVPDDVRRAATVANFSDVREWPSRVTVHDLLAHFLDIRSVPRRSFLEQLSFFATDAEQREKLLEMSQAAGADIYHMYCTQERRSYVDVLMEFTSVRLPLAYLLELVPPLSPREYSIASAPEAGPNLQLCIALIDYKTKFGRRIQGVCSAWVASLAVGDAVLVRTRPGTMRLPPHDPVSGIAPPIIMVGPGTGIAPMRSLALQARAATLASPSLLPRHVEVYFGCRHQAQDWLYGAEFTEWTSAPPRIPSRYQCAFSRDQPNKLYVQGLMLRDKALVSRLLVHDGAYLFIAGSAKRMPTDVLDIVRKCIVEVEGVSDADAAKIVSTLERTRRIVVEAWS